MEKLLIVDDREDIRKQLKWGLAKEYEVSLPLKARRRLPFSASTGRRLLPWTWGFLPMRTGPARGFRCLEEILRMEPATKVIVVTGNDERKSALRAVRTGAYDFYRKPIELGELKVVIGRAFHIRAH